VSATVQKVTPALGTQEIKAIPLQAWTGPEGSRSLKGSQISRQ